MRRPSIPVQVVSGIYTYVYPTISFFFFFSSRRRHTRCSRDWSSDVCSSDLIPPLHYVERGTLKDSFTVAGGDDPSSQQWEPTVPSRVAAKAAARLGPVKRHGCARLRGKGQGAGGEVESDARPMHHSVGDVRP